MFYGRSARHWLQKIGTEFFRDGVSPDIWVDGAVRHIDSRSADLFILSDGRFPNEADVMRKAGEEKGFRVLILKIVRDKVDKIGWLRRLYRKTIGKMLSRGDKHRSETSVDLIRADETIRNDKGLAELAEEADRIVREHPEFFQVSV